MSIEYAHIYNNIVRKHNSLLKRAVYKKEAICIIQDILECFKQIPLNLKVDGPNYPVEKFNLGNLNYLIELFEFWRKFLYKEFYCYKFQEINLVMCLVDKIVEEEICKP